MAVDAAPTRFDGREWFRAPRHYECGRSGDCRRFLWIAEPVKGEGCYGVAYAVSEQMICELLWEPADNMMKVLKAAAAVELFRRICAYEKQDPGMDWITYLYPMTCTIVDGQVILT